MNTATVVGVAAVSIAATAPIMGMFLPNVYEVRSGNVSVDGKGIRHALILGGGVAVGVGLAASTGTGSAAPIIGAMLGVVLIACVYEWSMRNPVRGS